MLAARAYNGGAKIGKGKVLEYMEMSLAQTMPVMVTQIAAMFLMMGIGVVLFRRKMLTNEGISQMSTLALYVATSGVILRSLAIDFDPALLGEAVVCVVLTIAFTVMSAAVARLIYRDRQRIAQLGIMISNMGFIGIPLVESVMGPEYVFYISVCIATQITLTWTYGVWLVANDTSVISARKILTNPAVVSSLVGFVLFIAPVELPGVVYETIDGMANLNEGLAMLILGSYLAQTDIRSLLRDKNLYLASFVRLIVVPALVIAVLAFVPVAVAVKMVLVIGFAAPCGAVSAMFPQLFGGDYRFGAGLVSSSTLLSLLSMPLMLAAALVVF